MKITIFVLAISFLLTGCVTDKTMNLPDGTIGHHVTCGGAIYSMGDCIQKAGEICGNAGYNLLGANGEVIPYSTASGGWSASASGGMASGSGGFQSQSGNFVQRDLFIKCKQ